MSIENAESQMNSLESEIANALNSMDPNAAKDLNLDSASNEDPNKKIDNFSKGNKIEQSTDQDGIIKGEITIQKAGAVGGTFEEVTRSFTIPTKETFQKLKDENKLYKTDTDGNISYTDEAASLLKKLQTSMENMDINGQARNKEQSDDDGNPLLDNEANKAINELNNTIVDTIDSLYNTAPQTKNGSNLFQDTRDVIR